MLSLVEWSMKRVECALLVWLLCDSMWHALHGGAVLYVRSSAHFRFFDASLPLNVHSADSIGRSSLETMAMETKKRKASQRQCKSLLN